MMRRLVEAYGAEYEQWRALTRVGIKLDLRAKRLATPSAQRKRKRLDIPPGIFVYGVLGIMFGGMLATVPDLLSGVTIIISYAMFMTATTVLLEYHTVVTAPDDYFILGYQPVSSRTYFAARITNLLVFVLFTTTLFAAVPCVVVGFRGHLRPEVGVMLYFGISLSAVLTALLMVLIYAWLVHRVDGRRLQRLLTYLQLVVSTVVYGGYAFLPQLLQRFNATQARLPESWLLLLYPPFWFASFMELVLGHVTGPLLVAAVLGIVATLLLARAAAGRISLDFAEKLADMSVSGVGNSAKPATHHTTWGMGKDEGRAVWLLVRAQFRSDNKFRLGVLAILPMTLLYLMMALAGGGIHDPFVDGARSFGSTGPIYLAIILFPVIMMTSITSSDQYQASWVFFATPADRHATLLAMRRAVFIAFVLPYLAFMAVVFAFFFHNLLHVLVHMLLLALLCNLSLLLMLVIDPKLPFSRPRVKGERSARLFGLGMLAAMSTMIAIPLAARFVYISAQRTAILLASLWLLGVVVERLGRVRVRRQVIESEFAG